MAITRFQDLPSENTPINSENLNGNFDELGVKVGTSVDNNYRTNILYNKNLLYEVTLTNEYRLNATGGLIDETGWSTTDYIEVEENTEYIINITRTSEFHRICFYNNSKVFLSKDESVNATFTTPANTKYIRFSSYTADFSGGILQKGSSFTIPSIVVDGETIYVKSSDTLPVAFKVTKDDTYVQNIINNSSYKYGKLVNLNLNIQPKDATIGTGSYKLASGAPAPLNEIEFFAGEYTSNGNVLQRLFINENGDIYWWYNNQFENTTGCRIAVNLVYLTTD